MYETASVNPPKLQPTLLGSKTHSHTVHTFLLGVNHVLLLDLIWIEHAWDAC